MLSERVERRLTAILAADVAGYSRLMGAGEEGTLAALKAIRCDVGDPPPRAGEGRNGGAPISAAHRPSSAHGGRKRGRRAGGRRSAAGVARQAGTRGFAVPEHERRPRAGIFPRRHGWEFETAIATLHAAAPEHPTFPQQREFFLSGLRPAAGETGPL
jgi:class 3 adenylate cyclase